MDDLLQELKELLAEAGLPEPGKLLGKRYVCTAGIATLYGTIVSIDDANDDGFLSLGVTSQYFRGDTIEGVWFGNGKTYVLHSWREGPELKRKSELSQCSFQLID